jgi:hypothetical protein
MAYTPYYAPYSRPMGYYNPSIPNDANMQNQQPIQQPQQMQMQQPIQQMPIVQPSQVNDMIWVLSEVEAQSFPVAPNNSVILWDKNNDVIYIKSANMQGVPSMRILDYTERTPENANRATQKHECQCGSKFVSIDKFEALQFEFEAMRNELEDLKAKSKAKITKKSIDEVENDG